MPVRLTPAGSDALTVTPVAVSAESGALVTDNVYLPLLAEVAPKLLVKDRSAKGGSCAI